MEPEVQRPVIAVQSDESSQFFNPRTLVLIPLIALFAGNAVQVVWLLNGMNHFQFIRNVYMFNTVQLPPLILVLGLTALASVKSWRADRKSTAAALFNICLAVFLGATHVWGTYIEPQWLAVRHERIVSVNARAPLRIVHITDIQSPRIGRYEERAFQKIADLKPDLLLCTGDFLQPLGDATWVTNGRNWTDCSHPSSRRWERLECMEMSMANYWPISQRRRR